MLIKACAKINVALNVVCKREDNYHDIDSVFLPLDLYDVIDVALVPKGFGTFITCDDYSLSASSYNLAQCAIDKARAMFGFKDHFRVHIHKSIPIAAGLGGGSSDAAAVLKAVLSLCKIQATKEQLISLASSIGSDVVYFLDPKPARVLGKGDIMNPFHLTPKYEVLLIKPSRGLSTTEVFKSVDDYPSFNVNIEDIIKALQKGDLKYLSSHVANDLTNPAFALFPELANVIDIVKKDGFEVVGMSGSGSTIFALTFDKHKALRLLPKYQKAGFHAILCETLGGIPHVEHK
jgi:4-diphosphocytidyl-2-C-methyl-D-erythritol kinase/energy-coupling factor transport system substrate-specific component